MADVPYNPPGGMGSGGEGATPMAPSATPSASASQSDQVPFNKEMLAQMQKPQTHLAPPVAKGMSGKQMFGLGMLSMFVPMIGPVLARSVMQEKENQINTAVAHYQVLGQALEDAQAASGGDQQKMWQMFGQNPQVMAILNDKKIRKQMAKALLNVDWLNPEKSQGNVYHQGLKRYMTLHPASKLMHMLGGIVKGHQEQPQQPTSPQESQANLKQFEQMAPRTTTMPDPSLIERSGQLALQQRDKWQYMYGSDGRVYALDKTNPMSKPLLMKDSEGNPVQGKTAQEGKVVNVEGKPTGIIHNGRVEYPGSPNWNANLQAQFEGAMKAYNDVEAKKDKRIELATKNRVLAYLNSRFYSVIDNNTGQPTMVNAATLQAQQGRYMPSGPGMKAMNANAIFDEIDYTSNMLMGAIEGLPDTPLDAKTRAQIAVVLKDADPRSAWQQFIGSTAANTLTDEQVDYITSIVAMEESAMSLRSLAGMGQGSDQLRSAIIKMLPAGGTPSKAYARRQMELFKGELTQLRKGVPVAKTPGLSQPGNDKFDQMMQKWLNPSNPQQQ